jgi:hypothetical protein
MDFGGMAQAASAPEPAVAIAPLNEHSTEEFVALAATSSTPQHAGAAHAQNSRTRQRESEASDKHFGLAIG